MSNQTVSEESSYSYNGKVMLPAFICLLLVVAFVVFLHLYARWFLRRSQRRSRNQDRIHIFVVDDESMNSPNTGLEAWVLSSLPVFCYKREGKIVEEMECAVCLSFFEDGEKGRILPLCKHGFHIKCIDTWLESHLTCPICRASAMPVSVESEMGGGEVRQNSNSSNELSADGGQFLEGNPDGASQLEVCIDLPVQILDQQESQSACSSLSSLKRMLSKNRSERKVFPSTENEDDREKE